MNLDLTGKHALVCGSTQGIGKAIALGLAEMGAEALLECLGRLQSGNMPEPVAQDNDMANYASKLEKSEALINWHEPAIITERRIRAFNPWPVCWCEINGERLRIWQAEALAQAHSSTPGDIISASPGGIEIATADGVLRLLQIQRAGGKRMPVAQYLNAHPILS